MLKKWLILLKKAARCLPLCSIKGQILYLKRQEKLSRAVRLVNLNALCGLLQTGIEHSVTIIRADGVPHGVEREEEYYSTKLPTISICGNGYSVCLNASGHFVLLANGTILKLKMMQPSMQSTKMALLQHLLLLLENIREPTALRYQVI